MMTLRLQIIIGTALVIGLIAILNMVRTKSLELKYALTWLLLDIALLVIVLVPGVMGGLSRLLGIYNAMNMIFFLGFIFMLIIAFVMTVSLSRNSKRIRTLTQQMALLEKELKEVKSKN